MNKITLISIILFGLTLKVSAQAIPNYVPLNGLLAYYPLDGNANDLSANGNNLNLFGSPAYTTNVNGIPNTACHFPNGNDYFETPTSSWSLINNLSEGTVSFWIFLDSQYVSNHYFGIDNSFMIKHEWGVGEDLFFGIQSGTTKIRMQISGTFPASPGMDVIGSTTLNFNTWYHVVGVWNGTTHTLYLNGNIDGQINSVLGVPNRPLPDYFSIGSCLVGGNGDPNYPSGAYGSMDDIGFWNRALTPAEITDLNQGCTLTVSTQPINQTVNITDNAYFITATTDTSANYQWQTNLGIGFQDLTNAGQFNGATSDSLSISNTTLSNNNQQFRCVINSGTCMDTSDIAILTINNNLGIGAISENKIIEIYPNPITDQINIKSHSNLIGSDFNIKNQVGQVVKNGKILSQITKIELNNLPDGIYILSIKEKFNHTFKMIKNDNGK